MPPIVHLVRHSAFVFVAVALAAFGAAPAGAVTAPVAPVARIAAIAPVAPAAAPVRISRVQYDSPGVDDRSNASLNGEFVVLTNPGAGTVALQGYTVRDKTGHTFTFATALALAPHASVAIHSGRGTNSAAHRYWGLSTYVWNNGGDAAALHDAKNHALQACSWKTVAPGYVNC